MLSMYYFESNENITFYYYLHFTERPNIYANGVCILAA